jgi:hypothetical protein
MSKIFDELCAIIEAQQQGKEDTDVFMVGEQLKDIGAESDHNAAILAQDLVIDKMGIADAAKALENYAYKNRGKANRFCITPKVADGILRNFYGIEKNENGPAKRESHAPENTNEEISDILGDIFSAEDFL